MNGAVMVLGLVIFALVGNTTTSENLSAIMGVNCGSMTAAECYLYLESMLPECPKNYYGKSGAFDLLDRSWCR